MKKKSKSSRVKKTGATKKSGSSSSKKKSTAKESKGKELTFDFEALKVLNLKEPVKVYGCFEASSGECSIITGGITCTSVSVACYTC